MNKPRLLCAYISILLMASSLNIFAQDPIYHRFVVKGATVISFEDSPGKGVKEALRLDGQTYTLNKKEQSYPTPSINVFLIQYQNKQILIDTGYGKLLGTAERGRLSEYLPQVTSPEKIDAILLTHLHPDHIGGLLTDGRQTFPNAIVYVPEQELAYWNNQSPQENPTFEAQRSFQKHYTIIPVKANDVILSVFTVIDTPGHTPGHVSYLFKGQSEHILFWGDIVHYQDIQIKNPDVYVSFDIDPKQAIATRKSIFNRVVKNNEIIAGVHLPTPGIIRLSLDKEGHYHYQTLKPSSDKK